MERATDWMEMQVQIWLISSKVWKVNYAEKLNVHSISVGSSTLKILGYRHKYLDKGENTEESELFDRKV